MPPVNISRHIKKFKAHKRSLRYFITRTENNPPSNLGKLADEKNKEVWAQIDCLSCANCCRAMSPTYAYSDIKRISVFLGMKPKTFKEKWLYLDKKENDWMNKSRPCQFLDLKTNMCKIYEVRPADCVGFPHLVKKPITDYMYVHKQNIEYCPATMLFVEKMYEAIKG